MTLSASGLSIKQGGDITMPTGKKAPSPQLDHGAGFTDEAIEIILQRSGIRLLLL
jgi:hypothetical protein